jgi:hypothetical protein
MPEEFSLEQLHRDGPTVDRQKGLSRPAAQIVERPRAQLFSCAGLADEQHGGLGAGQEGELRLHRHERRVFTDKLPKPAAICEWLASCGPLLPITRRQEAPDAGAHVGRPKGREKRVVGPPEHPAEHMGQIRRPPYPEEGRVGGLGPQRPEELLHPMCGRWKNGDDES